MTPLPFEEHLRSCEQCQDRRRPSSLRWPGSLPLAAPAAEPPPDLELKILAAVRYAVMTGSRTEPEPEPDRRPELAEAEAGPSEQSEPLVAPPLDQSAAVRGHRPGRRRGDRGRIHRRPRLSSRPLQQWRRRSTSRPSRGRPDRRPPPPVHANGWGRRSSSQRGTCRSLARVQFYECWYAWTNNRPGIPAPYITATFARRNGTFTMWSAADPAKCSRSCRSRSRIRRATPASTA